MFSATMAVKKQKPGPDPESIQSKDARFAGWFSRSQAVQKTGKSLSTIKRMIDSGDIVAEVDSDGIWWCSPDDINALEKAAPTEGHAGFVDATTSHIKQLHDHEETLIRLITDPANAALKIIMDTNKRLTAENADLRERDRANYEAREKLLSEAHERELASRMVDAREKRYEEGFKLLMQYAPKLLEQASGASKLKPLASLVVSLDDAMIDMLVPEFLTEKQAKDLKEAKKQLITSGIKPDPQLLKEKEEPSEKPAEEPTKEDSLPVEVLDKVGEE